MNCEDVPRQKCVSQTKTVCSNIHVDVCRNVPGMECNDVPRMECESHEDFDEPVERKEEKEVCVDKEVSRYEETVKCDQISQAVHVPHPILKEECKEVPESRTSLVPVKVCKEEHVEVWKPFQEKWRKQTCGIEALRMECKNVDEPVKGKVKKEICDNEKVMYGETQQYVWVSHPVCISAP